MKINNRKFSIIPVLIIVGLTFVTYGIMEYIDRKEKEKQELLKWEFKYVRDVDVTMYNKTMAEYMDAYFTELENPENTIRTECVAIRDSTNAYLLENVDYFNDEDFAYWMEELIRADSIYSRRKHLMK